MISFTHARLRYTLILAAGLAAGCAGGDDLPREAISGTVTLDGQPLADGVIQFTPAGGSGQVSGGTQIQGGKYSIAREQGLVPGSYNVAINAATKSERTKPAQVGAGRAAELPKELIPAKYNSATELKAEVKKGGPHDFSFTLQSK
jgi:hypothetical protein